MRGNGRFGQPARVPPRNAATIAPSAKNPAFPIEINPV